MIPTSTFRETLLLILFGIVLVPIAAKRAQDAPGYWQTFFKDLSSHQSAYEESPLWVPGLSSAPSLSDQTAARRPQLSVEQIVKSVGAAIPNPARSSSRKGGGRAAQLQNSRHPKHVTNSADKYQAQTDTQPRVARTIRFSTETTGEEAVAGAAKMPVTAAATVASISAEARLTTAAKASEASRGRWTLIWMGSAIAAVAVFMSLC